MKICGLNFGLLKLALNLKFIKFMRFMKFGGLNLGLKFVEFSGLNLNLNSIKNAVFAVIARRFKKTPRQSTSLNSRRVVIARLDEVKSWRFKRSGFRVSENELRVRQHEVKSTSLKFTKFSDLNLSLNFLNLTQIYQKIHALNFTQKFATADNQTLILNSPQKRAQNG